MAPKRIILVLVTLAVMCSISYAADPEGTSSEKGILETLPGKVPYAAGMAITPDGSLLVVSRRYPGAIFEIDPTGKKKAKPSTFKAGAGLCNPRFIAVDASGFVYVDTSRPIKEKATVGHVLRRRKEILPGLFRISPDGKEMSRFENLNENIRGLLFDNEGRFVSCNFVTPLEEEEKMGKVAERLTDKYFGGSSDERPYIMRARQKGTFHDTDEADELQRLDEIPTDIAMDSRGNLIYIAGRQVMKLTFGPKKNKGSFETIAIICTVNPEACEAIGIGVDEADNIYIGTANPYVPAGGTVTRIDPQRKASIFATGLGLPADIIADAEGNIYISDMKQHKVYRVSAEVKNSGGPFRPKIEENQATFQKSPEAKTDVAKEELKSLEDQLASVETELKEVGNVEFPDTLLLNTGKEMECKILEETDDSVRVETEFGTVNVFRGRILSVKYSTKTPSEIADLEKKKTELESRTEELRPSKGSPRPEEYSEKVKQLMADREKRRADRTSRFLDSAKAGDAVTLNQSLDDGIDPDTRDHNRRTPLMLAAFEGHGEIMEILLNRGASLEARDVDGWTALTYAAYGGRTSTVRLLISKGADVNARVNSGQSVLTVAKQKNHRRVIKILEQAGATD